MGGGWDWMVIGEALGWTVINGLNLGLQKIVDWRIMLVMINHTYIQTSISQSLINGNPSMITCVPAKTKDTSQQFIVPPYARHT